MAQPGTTAKEAATVADLVSLRQKVDGLGEQIAQLAQTDSRSAGELIKVRNLFTYAFVSEDAYFDRSIPQLLPSGVERRDLASVAGLSAQNLDEYNASGYRPALYYNSNDSGYILANRGTVGANVNEAIKSWGTNIIQNVFGLKTAQFEQAVDLGIRLNERLEGNITFTGHSLGGALAAAQALATGRQAVTFNAEGLSRGTISRLDLKPANASQVTNYYVPGEPLALLQNNLVVDAAAAYYATIPKNVLALAEAVGEVFAGQTPSFGSFGIAYIPEAAGTQVKLPEVGGSLLRRHYMESVFTSMEYRLDQIAPFALTRPTLNIVEAP